MGQAMMFEVLYRVYKRRWSKRRIAACCRATHDISWRELHRCSISSFRVIWLEYLLHTPKSQERWIGYFPCWKPIPLLCARVLLSRFLVMASRPFFYTQANVSLIACVPRSLLSLALLLCVERFSLILVPNAPIFIIWFRCR